MSDFLSNFNKDNYDNTKEKKDTEPISKTTEVNRNSFEDKHNFAEGGANSSSQPKEEITSRTAQKQSELDVEIDPDYQKKKRQKQQLIAIGSVLAIIILFFCYYQATHVKLPDFVGKNISDARAWAIENKVKIDVKQEYDLKAEVNQVIAQKQKKNGKIKKGSTLNLTASLGANPEENLKLPDFMTMKKSEVEQWIKENNASNISVIEEYSDTKAKGEATRFEIVNKDVTRDSYKRKDKANMYFSKGKETFEKTISVPDFRNKAKSEVETWAKTNAISITYEQASSPDVAVDSIVSQSIEKDQKIAKKDSMTVVVSLGKGYAVPDFSGYTLEEASSAVDGLSIQAKSVFTDNVPYGQLISQSVPAGTQLTSKDDLKVKVLYSAGKPYLKDLRGNTTEGELQKWFYDEFQSKGATVKYTIRYVDSAQTKGTVVGMSAYNLYIPLNYTVAIDISLGNLGDASAPASKTQDNISGNNSNNNNSNE